MINVISAIFVGGLLLLVHELGHFLMAKLRKVRVEKFSLGFGPKIISHRIGETQYLLSLIPLGGYIKMAGDSPEDKPTGASYEFLSKKVSERLGVVAAGPLMNVILAIVIFTIVFSLGLPHLTGSIGTVLKDSPAGKAGLKAGDKIISINGKPVEDWNGLTKIIQRSPNKQLPLEIERGSEKLSLMVTPALEGISQVGLIGITPDYEKSVIKKYSPFTSLGLALSRTLELIKIIYIGLWQLITGQVSLKYIGGPLLIAQLAGQQAQLGLINLFLFIALISVNLAVLNFLPIPILDGGHILFLFIEGLTGRPVSKKRQEMAQQFGMAVLIGLMLLATYNDILRFLHK
jgi:regulator of sigma E protease